MTLTCRYVSVAILAVITGCGDDAPSSATANSARLDAGTGTGSPANQSPSMPDSRACGAIASRCSSFDDAEGLGNLCLRVSSTGDAEQCAALVNECEEFCNASGVSPSVGDLSAEQCAEVGDRCDELDGKGGLFKLCHDIGHSGNLSWCAATYDECTSLCGGGGVSLDAGAVTQVTLNFRATFGEQDFACGQNYAGQGSSRTLVTPQDFRFYVSDVRLVDDAGVEVPVSLDARGPFQGGGVALLDFEDGSGACENGSPELNSVVTGRVPVGNYTGIRFTTAVPFELNHQDPTTLPAPLQAGGMTWGWLYGYKFIKAEVRQVQSSEEAQSADAGVPAVGLFHLGSTGCSNQSGPDAGSDFAAAPIAECDKPGRNQIALSGFNPASSVIVADVAALFAATDLASGNAFCHSAGDPCPSLFENVGIDYSSGAALGTQSVFRVQ